MTWWMATACTAPSDGGKTWTHIGLDDTRHIGRIWVDPKNPDVVLVAALATSSVRMQRAWRVPQ